MAGLVCHYRNGLYVIPHFSPLKLSSTHYRNPRFYLLNASSVLPSLCSKPSPRSSRFTMCYLVMRLVPCLLGLPRWLRPGRGSQLTGSDWKWAAQEDVIRALINTSMCTLTNRRLSRRQLIHPEGRRAGRKGFQKMSSPGKGPFFSKSEMVCFAELIPSNKFILLCQLYLVTVSPGWEMDCWFLPASIPLLCPPRGGGGALLYKAWKTPHNLDQGTLPSRLWKQMAFNEWEHTATFRTLS